MGEAFGTIKHLILYSWEPLMFTHISGSLWETAGTGHHCE